MLFTLRNNAMTDFLRLSAYAFLALVGLWAWSTRIEGWRYYLGIALFVLGTLRILTILRQRMQRARAGRSGEQAAQPEASGAKTPDESSRADSTGT